MSPETRKSFLKWFKPWSLWGAILLVIICWIPFLVNMHMIPRSDFDDWQLVMMSNQALQNIIIDYGQFPYWNPWHHGGVPIFSHPGASIFSIDTFLAILFGGIIGSQIMAPFYVIFGVIGMWFFLEKFNPLPRFWGCILFGLQGAVLMHVTVGHTIMLTFVWLPWILYFALRIMNGLKYVIQLGVCMGLMYNQFLHYVGVMNTILLGCALVPIWWHNRKDKNFYLNGLAAFLTFLALCSYKLFLFWDMIGEFPREIPPGRFHIPLTSFIKALFWPAQHIYTKPDPVRYYWSWYELGCYIGIMAFIMFLFSAKKGVRWWHIGAVITLLLSINATSPYLPGYWMWKMPVFNNMFVFTRWRLMATFFIIFGSVQGLSMLLDSKWKHREKIAYVIVSISLCGLIFSQYYNWEHRKLDSEDDVLSKVKIKSDTILTADTKCFFYAATKNNIALVNSFEPMLYKKQRCCQIPFNHPKYPGEVCGLNGKLTKYDWTPNEITLYMSGPGFVRINQNPGRYWHLNGQVLYPEMRAFEPEKQFIFYVPAKGVYKLSVYPDKHITALYLNLLCALAAVILLFYLHKQRKGEKQS